MTVYAALDVPMKTRTIHTAPRPICRIGLFPMCGLGDSCVQLTREELMVAALPIRTDLSAGELRALARRGKDPRAALRLYAIAHALEGLSRAEAARLSGLERPALHDAAVRHNVEGLAGLHDRPKGRRRPVLSDKEGAMLKDLVLAGPDLARPGRTEWTLPALAEEIARLWGKRLHPASLSRGLRRLGLSKPKTRPRHPQANAEAQDAFKGGRLEALSQGAAAHPDRRIELWFADEARVGQKGRPPTAGGPAASARRACADHALRLPPTSSPPWSRRQAPRGRLCCPPSPPPP